MLENSGLEAKALRLSTASSRGAVAARHWARFSSVKAPSRAWKQQRGLQTQPGGTGHGAQASLQGSGDVGRGWVGKMAGGSGPKASEKMAQLREVLEIQTTMTLMVLTRLAVLLATSLADWTN